jgi:hypothetical protein
MVCLDARQAQRALDMQANKTDANDADGLAHLVRAGWYTEVRVKSRDAMLSKGASAARRQLLDISTNLSNQVRGLMKTFGLVVDSLDSCSKLLFPSPTLGRKDFRTNEVGVNRHDTDLPHREVSEERTFNSFVH